MTGKAPEKPKEAKSSELIRSIQKEAKFPLGVMIELTRRCNLQCAHCFLDLDHQGGQPTATIKRWLDELADEGSLFLTFTGGEPTLRPDWLELARYARRRSFAFTLKTNGTRITEELAAQIADLDPMSVQISLYSSRAEIHDRVTGVQGSHQRAIDGIKRLRHLEVKVLSSTPVMSLNAEGLHETSRLAQDLGCKQMLDSRICTSLDAERDMKAVEPTQAMVDSTIAEAVRHGYQTPSPKAPVITRAAPAWSCFLDISSLYIRADGELWRCARFPLSFGSVVDQPIATVWYGSPVLKALRRLAHIRPKACDSCEIEWACARCAGNAMAEHGDLETPATTDCQSALALARQSLVESEKRCNTPGTSHTYLNKRQR